MTQIPNLKPNQFGHSRLEFAWNLLFGILYAMRLCALPFAKLKARGEINDAMEMFKLWLHVWG
jgi:hypothetical protein